MHLILRARQRSQPSFSELHRSYSLLESFCSGFVEGSGLPSLYDRNHTMTCGGLCLPWAHVFAGQKSCPPQGYTLV